MKRVKVAFVGMLVTFAVAQAAPQGQAYFNADGTINRAKIGEAVDAQDTPSARHATAARIAQDMAEFRPADAVEIGATILQLFPINERAALASSVAWNILQVPAVAENTTLEAFVRNIAMEVPEVKEADLYNSLTDMPQAEENIEEVEQDAERVMGTVEQEILEEDANLHGGSGI